MVGITEISAIVAAAGVLVGVVYYALEIRHQSHMIEQQNKMRETDLLVRLFSNMMSRDWVEAWEKVRDRETLNYNDYKEKYGFVEVNEVYLFLDQLGRLLQKGLIGLDLLPLETGQISNMWEKRSPM